jgi:AcrR family transcriptional regulator
VSTNGDPVAAPTRVRRRLSEQQRRDQIVDACVAVLARDGFEQATLVRIAEAAGVSKGLVSHYFTERDLLLEHVAVTTAAALRETVTAQLDLTAPVPDVIRAAVHIAARLGRTHADQLKAIDEVARNLRAPDGQPRLDLRAYEDTYQAQQRLFQRGQDEKTLRDFDTRIMAVTYQGAIDTMIAYLHTHPSTDPDRYADGLVDLLLAAVCR